MVLKGFWVRGLGFKVLGFRVYGSVGLYVSVCFFFWGGVGGKFRTWFFPEDSPSSPTLQGQG